MVDRYDLCTDPDDDYSFPHKCEDGTYVTYGDYIADTTELEKALVEQQNKLERTIKQYDEIVLKKDQEISRLKILNARLKEKR